LRIDNVKLRSELVKAGISQKKLAESSGLSYSMTNAICNGRTCSVETVHKIAEALGVPVAKIQRK